uniref:25S rRNA (uridine-N(3))-methyltransferase BMT5-like domain-containing protein n=1 Tax=Plectus sambesii TaxID=2011161 RepID=A0A914V9R1_9BILA
MDQITNGHVLILGDGNLSFSLAFVKQHAADGVHFWCTVMESEAELINRYPTSRSNIDYLGAMPNVRLRFETDATRLKLEWFDGQLFEHIIMNFPHPGGKTNLRKCRALLSGIFESIPAVLAPAGRFLLSLAPKQSGLSSPIGSVISSEVPAHNKDSWAVIYLASYSGFLLQFVANFDPRAYPGYTCTGYLSQSKGFHQTGSETMIFTRATVLSASSLTADEQELQYFDQLHPLRPYYLHDVSFWLLNEDADHASLLKHWLVQISGGLVKRLSPLPELQYKCSERNATSVVYRLVWQSHFACLTRECCRDRQNLLRERITVVFSDERVPLELR